MKVNKRDVVMKAVAGTSIMSMLFLGVKTIQANNLQPAMFQMNSTEKNSESNIDKIEGFEDYDEDLFSNNPTKTNTNTEANNPINGTKDNENNEDNFGKKINYKKDKSATSENKNNKNNEITKLNLPSEEEQMKDFEKGRKSKNSNKTSNDNNTYPTMDEDTMSKIHKMMGINVQQGLKESSEQLNSMETNVSNSKDKINSYINELKKIQSKNKNNNDDLLNGIQNSINNTNKLKNVISNSNSNKLSDLSKEELNLLMEKSIQDGTTQQLLAQLESESMQLESQIEQIQTYKGDVGKQSSNLTNYLDNLTQPQQQTKPSFIESTKDFLSNLNPFSHSNDIDSELTKPIPVSPNAKLTPLAVPKNNTSMKSYMSYHAITAKSSPQYKLQHDGKSWTDEYGMRRRGQDYMIALGSYYGTTMGTRYIIEFESGTIITATLGDAKADQHTDAMNQQHLIDKSVVEFITDNNSKLNSKIKTSGNVSSHPGVDFTGNVISITRIEN